MLNEATRYADKSQCKRHEKNAKDFCTLKKFETGENNPGKPTVKTNIFLRQLERTKYSDAISNLCYR